jgi:hypothetical protein
MIEQQLVKRFDQLRSLYKDLYACLKEERRYIPQANVDELQAVVQKIEDTVLTIENERSDLLSLLSKYTGNKKPTLDRDVLIRFISPVYQYDFLEMYDEIDHLIHEIKRYGKENRFLIEDCLSFLDETMRGVLGAKDTNPTYDKEMKVRKIKSNNLLLSKEV